MIWVPPMFPPLFQRFTALFERFKQSLQLPQRVRSDDRRLIAPPRRKPIDLETLLLHLSPVDRFTIRNACEGVGIFGSNGSGKSSGSGRYLADAFLRAGFGGLVLTVKPDECEQWVKYAADAGRSDSLIIVEPGGRWRFNFLDYEMRRKGLGAGQTENIVRLLTTGLSAAQRGAGGAKEESYWLNTQEQLLRNGVDLCKISRGTVSLPMLHQIIMSAPQSAAQVHDPSWQAGSLCYQLLDAGDRKEKTPKEENDFQMTARYWLNEFPCVLPDRTRGSILSMFTSMADALLRGDMRELFCTDTTFVPELTYEGAIIIFNLPVKSYMQVGTLAQILFKQVWQQAVERRDVGVHPKPVFAFVDECHHLVTEHDVLFQTTARSSRACTVYLTQSLSNFHWQLGAEKGKALTNSLLGVLSTKVFHANMDAETNEWAASLFAKSWQTRANFGTSNSDTGASRSGGGSQTEAHNVPPETFTRLRKGGPENDFCVDAIIAQSGRIWNATGKTHLLTTFKQEV